MKNEIQYKSDLVIPWDNDNFSLNLEEFSKLGKTHSNMYPLVRSPLRQQWNTTIEEGGEPQVNEFNSPFHEPELNDDDNRRTLHKKRMFTKKRTHTSFPYNNSSHGPNPGNIEQDDIVVNKKPSVKKRGHVQHISPLLPPSPMIESAYFNRMMPSTIMSSTSMPSTATVPASSPSIRHKLSGIFSNARHSVSKSETASIRSADSTETWKISQRSTNPSMVIIPLSEEGRRSHSPTSVSSSTRIESPYYPRHSPMKSVSPRSFHDDKSVVSSTHSSAVHSYRSISVPNNADKLEIFEKIPVYEKSSVEIYAESMYNYKKKRLTPFQRFRRWFAKRST